MFLLLYIFFYMHIDYVIVKVQIKKIKSNNGFGFFLSFDVLFVLGGTKLYKNYKTDQTTREVRIRNHRLW